MSLCSCYYDGAPFSREMPQNKEFGLKSTTRTVILLLMDRPSPCQHRPGWSSFDGPLRP